MIRTSSSYGCAPEKPSQRLHRLRSSGVALVIVLGFLVLLAGLAIAFFSSVQLDLQSARQYSDGVTVRQLAENATSIIMGQIADGTRGHIEPGNPASQRLTWASQPGLIRTYDDAGAPGRVFKLYSSDSMVVAPGPGYSPSAQLATEVPDSWPGKPAVFVDMNRPVLVSDPSGSVVLTPGAAATTYTPQYPSLAGGRGAGGGGGGGGRRARAYRPVRLSDFGVYRVWGVHMQPPPGRRGAGGALRLPCSRYSHLRLRPRSHARATLFCQG
jgi:hypothetical protein